MYLRRFSLRMLLVAITVFCLIAGLWRQRSEAQRAAVARLRESGADVAYSYHRIAPGNYNLGRVQTRWPEVFVRWLGVDMLFDVESVSAIDARCSDADLKMVCQGIPSLLHFAPPRQVSEESLRRIYRHHGIRTLNLSRVPIGDSGLQGIESMKQLEELHLSETRVSDESVERLAALTPLKRLDLVHTFISENGAEQLRKRLPRCQVSWSEVGPLLGSSDAARRRSLASPSMGGSSSPGPDQVDAAIARLLDDASDTRELSSAISTLRDARCATALPALRRLYYGEYTSDEIRSDILGAVRLIPSDAATELLIEAVGDDETWVARNAHEFLLDRTNATVFQPNDFHDRKQLERAHRDWQEWYQSVRGRGHAAPPTGRNR